MACHSPLSSYIENVDQLVNDESKIVTYDYLSQTCGIHVNLAKQVLEEYSKVLEKRGVAKSYQFIHSVGGFKGKDLKFFIVPEDKLEHVKSQLDNVLSSHFYSVQKGKLGSLELLYNSNRTGMKPSIEQSSAYSGIKCSFVHSKPDIVAASHQVPVASSGFTKSSETKPSFESNAKPAVHPPSALSDQTENKINHDTSAQNGTKPTIKTEKKGSGKTALAAMFAKQAQAPPKKKPEPEPEEEKKPATNKRVVREPSDDEIENQEEKSHKTSTNKRFKLADEPKQEKKAEPKKAKKTAKRSGSLDKSKRRRIQQFSDSEDSENEENEQGEEDMILSSPERPTHPLRMSEDEDEDMIAGTPKQPSPNPKRTRKLVTKHYIDDDGFMVTKKEFETCETAEEETASDARQAAPKETQKEPVVKKEPEPAAKKTSPAKTKQKSIMSFFTKK